MIGNYKFKDDSNMSGTENINKALSLLAIRRYDFSLIWTVTSSTTSVANIIVQGITESDDQELREMEG